MIIFFRGPPGSGKSHLAKRYFGGLLHLEADMFCFKDGNYVFDRDNLDTNHALCQALFKDAVRYTGCDIVVSNTFSRWWEIEFYVETAKLHNQPYQIFCVKSQKVVAREVPTGVIAKMIDRWEDFDDEIVLENPIGEKDPVALHQARGRMNLKVMDWAEKAGFNIFGRATPITNEMSDLNVTDIDELDTE